MKEATEMAVATMKRTSGASVEARESGGRTALDFNVCPGGCGQSRGGLYDKLFHIHWPTAYLCDLGTSCG